MSANLPVPVRVSAQPPEVACFVGSLDSEGDGWVSVIRDGEAPQRLGQSGRYNWWTHKDRRQLAQTLLERLYGYELATTYKHRFAETLLVKLPRDGWTLAPEQVQAWLDIQYEHRLGEHFDRPSRPVVR